MSDGRKVLDPARIGGKITKIGNKPTEGHDGCDCDWKQGDGDLVILTYHSKSYPEGVTYHCGSYINRNCLI